MTATKTKSENRKGFKQIQWESTSSYIYRRKWKAEIVPIAYRRLDNSMQMQAT